MGTKMCYRPRPPYLNGHHVVQTESPKEVLGDVVPYDGNGIGIFHCRWGVNPWNPPDGPVYQGEETIASLLSKSSSMRKEEICRWVKLARSLIETIEGKEFMTRWEALENLAKTRGEDVYQAWVAWYDTHYLSESEKLIAEPPAKAAWDAAIEDCSKIDQAEPTISVEFRDEGGASEDVVLPKEATEDDIEDAAQEWVNGGDWGEGKVLVRVHWDIRKGTRKGEEGWFLLEAGSDPEPPDCVEDQEHEWCSPEWLGGCRENPGVWSLGGARISTREVCRHCGTYRIYESGEDGRTPDQTHYEEPDERSLSYVKDLGGVIPPFSPLPRGGGEGKA